MVAIHYNPINGLYSLLEPVSAENFCDESIPDLPINASKITWILTANDIKWIPSPILSRVCIFEIPAPDQNQAMQVARRIYSNLRLSSKVLTDKFEDELEDVVANILAKLSPRQMRIGIEIAFGKAALAKRNKLTEDDIDVVEVEEKMKIGFI
jgi:ATP-dependent Lon protease